MFRTSLVVIMLVISTALAAIALDARAQTRSCDMYTKFETPSETRSWRAVNDGVMGGLSSGGPRFENGRMIFQGVINTNGGGFSSLRSPVETGTFANASGMKLRLRSDGRAYKLTFRTNVTWRGRRISFQAPIPQTEPGEWNKVSVPFSALGGTIFGRAVRGADFDRAAVSEMGIILADGRDGPFKLEIDWMADCPS